MSSGSTSRGEELALFTTGQPQAINIGEGPHYYGVPSLLSTNWYPDHNGDTVAVGDWFEVAEAVELTGVTYWGLLMDYGGGPGELHVCVYRFDPGTGDLFEHLHAWDQNMLDWSAFCVAEEDPSGLGAETVYRWHTDLADLPDSVGSPCLEPGETYVLVVAGDDWADEFQWAANASAGLVGGDFDELYWSDTTDVASTGLNWTTYDLGHGPAANNLAFELTGVPAMPLGDFDEDCDVDYDDYLLFEICLSLSGPGLAPPFQECAAHFDSDDDQDVDMNDFRAFQLSFTGLGLPAPCCAP
ncbi:MAG: hypothetical protein GY778_32165 [bacterium]|nr:hypothetical protein [bacterium]